MGIGIDILDKNRIKKIYKKYKENFLKKFLLPEEIDFINRISNYNRKIEKISSFFAAKEAIKKISNDIKIKEILIKYDNNGKPMGYIKNKKIDISISHEKNYTIAVAQKNI